MEIAIVGTDAEALCRTAGIRARSFPSLRDAAGHPWDLLALTQQAEAVPLSAPLLSRTLLLPGDSDAGLAQSVRAMQVVGYGFSPRDTLTLSSDTGTERLLCIQRSLLTLTGELIEPQELPLSPALCALAGEQALLLAGVRLLCGASAAPGAAKP